MGKRNRIIYWIATLWLALGMVFTGVGQIVTMNSGTGGGEMMKSLDFPLYIMPLLGILKILGTTIILIPGFRLIKEWAYAGFFFLMSGAIFSHIEVDDPFSKAIPAILLLLLTVISWYLRPAGRKLCVIQSK